MLTARIAALVQSGGNGSFIGQLTTTSGGSWMSAPTSAVLMWLVELEPAQAATLPASLVLDRLEVAASGFEGPRRYLRFATGPPRNFAN